MEVPLASCPNATTRHTAWGLRPNLTTFPAGAFDTCPATDATWAFADGALDERGGT